MTLISELGTDFTKWPTVKHFASWLGLCPNFKQTGGKVKSSATRKGKNRAATALRLAAWSLMRSKSYLGAYLRRQRSRLGAPKAITATAHKLARILYNLMRYGVEYMQKTKPITPIKSERDKKRASTAGRASWATKSIDHRQTTSRYQRWPEWRVTSGESELTFQIAMPLCEIRGRPTQPVRAEGDDMYLSQRRVNARRLEKFLGRPPADF